MALKYLKNERDLALRGSILLTDGSTYELTADNVVRYVIDEASTAGESITLGDTRAADFDLEIEDAAHALTAALLIGARVTVEIGLDGAFDPLGVWYADSAQISRQSATVTIRGSDALAAKMDGLFVDGTYPATLGEVARRAAEQAGIALAAADFRNAGVVVQTKPEWDPETNTLRAVIGYIAGCAGGFARINRAGELEIVAYNEHSGETITADYFTTLAVGGGRSFAFNCLQVSYFGTNIYVRYAIDESRTDTAGDTLRVSDNPLITPEIAQSLVAELTGLESSAVSVDWIGDPALLPGTLITVRDTDGSLHSGIATRQMIVVDGGLHAQTSADLPSDIESTFAGDTLFTPAGRVNVQAIEGRLKVWAENEINIAVGGKADADDVEEMRTQIDLLDGEIALRVTESQLQEAVGGIEVGGRNLLLDSERERSVTRETSNQWTIYAHSPSLLEIENHTFLFSFEAYGSVAGMRVDFYFRDKNANAISPQQAITLTTGYAEYSQPVILNSNKSVSEIVECLFRVRGGTGTVYIRRAKLERGTMATDWTPAPEDAPKEVIDGSRFVIRKEGVRIDTPEYDVNVSGTAGDAHFGADGLAVDIVNSPSVMPRYTGPANLTVGGTVDGVRVFATLTDALAKLSGKFIPAPVTVTVTAGTYTEGCIYMAYTEGAAITVNASGATINGRLDMSGVKCPFTVNGLKLKCANSHTVQLYSCEDVRFVDCEITADKTVNMYYNVVYGSRSNITLTRTGMYSGHAGLLLENLCSAFVDECVGGNNYYGMFIRNGTQVGYATSYPLGLTTDLYSTADSEYRGSGATAGGTTPSAPEASTEATLALTASRTHDGSGWYSGTNVITQGKTSDGGVYKGCMWFDVSAVSGKTITSATLTMYRNAGVGSGNPVTVRIGTMSNTGASGAVATVTENDVVIGSVDQKEVLTVTNGEVLAAVQQLASGAAKGLYIWGPAASYAQFAGYGSGNAPVITVTYQ